MKMFNTGNLYNLFKPLNNDKLITDYQVIIGGTQLSADLKNGCIILSLISSQAVSSQYKDLHNLILNDDLNKENKALINECSIIENIYQIDIYKQNAENINYLEVEKEAIKIREWLKSFETKEYLQALNAYILPCYSQINFSSELINNNFINRATFDFNILTLAIIKENVNIFDKITIQDNLILKGD